MEDFPMEIIPKRLKDMLFCFFHNNTFFRFKNVMKFHIIFKFKIRYRFTMNFDQIIISYFNIIFLKSLPYYLQKI